MAAQPTFSELEMGMGRPRETRRPRLLAELEAACPWEERLAPVRRAREADARERGADPRPGRPREDDAAMPRMCMVQVRFGLSDRECEERVWDSAAMRRFAGVAPGAPPRCASSATSWSRAASARRWCPPLSTRPPRAAWPSAAARSSTPPSSSPSSPPRTPPARATRRRTGRGRARTGTSATSRAWAWTRGRACPARSPCTPRTPATSTSPRPWRGPATRSCGPTPVNLNLPQSR